MATEGTATKDGEVVLTKGQSAACSTVMKGRNLLLLGPPGTGKTLVLTWVARELLEKQPDRRVCITAPHGSVVCRLQEAGLPATTVHAAFGLTPALLNMSRKQLTHIVTNNARNKPAHPIHHVANLTLIIDEFGLLGSTVFVAIEYLLRFHGDRSLPFGGAQIILCGDPTQLSPVKDRFVFEDEPSKKDEEALASIFSTCMHTAIVLHTLHRARDVHLRRIIELLVRHRDGACCTEGATVDKLLQDEELMGALRARITPLHELPEEVRKHVLQVAPHHKRVNEINRSRLAGIDAPKVELVWVHGIIDAALPSLSHRLKELNTEMCQNIRKVRMDPWMKVGALVRVTMGFMDGMVNGTMAVITAIRPPAKPMSEEDTANTLRRESMDALKAGKRTFVSQVTPQIIIAVVDHHGHIESARRVLPMCILRSILPTAEMRALFKSASAAQKRHGGRKTGLLSHGDAFMSLSQDDTRDGFGSSAGAGAGAGAGFDPSVAEEEDVAAAADVEALLKEGHMDPTRNASYPCAWAVIPPIKWGWSATLHSIQGGTWASMVVHDPSRMFVRGMGLMALSRVASLDRIWICAPCDPGETSWRNMLRVNDTAQAFMHALCTRGVIHTNGTDWTFSSGGLVADTQDATIWKRSDAMRKRMFATVLKQQKEAMHARTNMRHGSGTPAAPRVGKKPRFQNSAKTRRARNTPAPVPHRSQTGADLLQQLENQMSSQGTSVSASMAAPGKTVDHRRVAQSRKRGADTPLVASAVASATASDTASTAAAVSSQQCATDVSRHQRMSLGRSSGGGVGMAETSSASFLGGVLRSTSSTDS